MYNSQFEKLNMRSGVFFFSSAKCGALGETKQNKRQIQVAAVLNRRIFLRSFTLFNFNIP